jgi:hypothetical protein
MQQGSSSSNNNSSGLLPGASMGSASPISSWMLQQQLQQQQHLMMSPHQLQLQQQHSGCMADGSCNSRPFDLSTASSASANSMTSVQRQASLMRQFSMESAGSSSSQLPQLVLQQQQQQDAGMDAAGIGKQHLHHLPLQLVSPDGLSLNPAGPYVAGARPCSSSRIAAAGRPAGADSPAAAAGGGVMPGTRLSVVPEGAAAAAAAGVRLGSGSGSGTSGPVFRDGSGSSTNSSLSCPYAASNVMSPGCASITSPDNWCPAVGLASAVSASPGNGMSYQTAQLPVQQQQYVTGSPAVPPAQMEALGAQLQQMQLSGASQAIMNELFVSASTQAEIKRQQAALAQAVADAASDRLDAYVAAMGSNSAESMAAMGASAANAAACSSVCASAGVAGVMAASPHAQQYMVQVQQQQQQLLAQHQQHQQMLQSDRLMILLDDQAAAAAAAGAPMLVTQCSAGMQQQYVLHSTPQASGEGLMAPRIPSTTWM